ncbi:hypothetical protein CPB85DRAFT_1258820 [Mucidula mucida]|nr:hypothetical protein CPB85DRAFT_1258820 [Mucidula mucida]
MTRRHQSRSQSRASSQAGSTGITTSVLVGEFSGQGENKGQGGKSRLSTNSRMKRRLLHRSMEQQLYATYSGERKSSEGEKDSTDEEGQAGADEVEVQRENGLVEPSGDDSEEATLTPWSCWSAPRALNIFVLEEVPMRQCDDSTKNNKGVLAMVRVGSTLTHGSGHGTFVVPLDSSVPPESGFSGIEFGGLAVIDGSNASTYNADTFEPSPGSDNIMAMRMMNAPEYRSTDFTMMATIPRYEEDAPKDQEGAERVCGDDHGKVDGIPVDFEQRRNSISSNLLVAGRRQVVEGAGIMQQGNVGNILRPVITHSNKRASYYNTGSN